MASVPCHYLRLRPLLPSRFFPEVPDDGSMEDAACFIKVMLLAGAIVSCHYLLSCLLLLFGGIMRGCHTLFVPWLVAHALILVMLSMSAAAEVNEEEKKVPLRTNFYFFHMCFRPAWLLDLSTCPPPGGSLPPPPFWPSWCGWALSSLGSR